MKTKYYLAYGSNLNVAQMNVRCPGATILGTATIPGYRLLFKGSKSGSYLTIEKAEGYSVPVGVWEVTKEDERNLDYYEGYPTFYYKKPMTVTLDGTDYQIKAFAYIMREDRPIGKPTDFYVYTCARGYHDFGFDPKALIEALKYSENGGREHAS